MESPFRAIAEFTYDWESWISPEGKLKWVNPAVERISGYSVSECHLMADYPQPIVHPSDRPSLIRVFEQARLGKSGNHFEFRVLRKDGQIRWAAISWQPITVRGQSVGFRSSVRDIHQQKQMEADLQRALREAEIANHAKTDFLANVTHELRTPLQSIIGYAQILESEFTEEPFSNYIRVLIQQSQHLEYLVSDLLDLSALQSGVLHFRNEAFLLDEVIDRTVAAMKPLAEKKSLQLIFNPSGSGIQSGDPIRISQILINLIKNAIKFTSHGKVVVTAKAVDKKNELHIDVEDTGEGLPKNFQVFEPFSQGDVKKNTPREGVGLGLAICSQLCTHMGGSLETRQSSLGGACLRVVLPRKAKLKKSEQDAFDSNKQKPFSVDKRFANRFPLSILVIDDVDAPRDCMGATMRALGYKPTLAPSADEAFSLVRHKSFDVAFVDIQMPDIDGWATAVGLRARLKNIYLVALTAQSISQYLKLFHQSDFNEYTQKPLRFDALQKLLEKAFHHKNAHAHRDIFNMNRWKEMETIENKEGEILLLSMQKKILCDLPKLLDQIQRHAKQKNKVAFKNVLHNANGLFAIIGAEKAQQIASTCEQLNGLPDEQLLSSLLKSGQEVCDALRTLKEL